jgi:hypothetical protein
MPTEVVAKKRGGRKPKVATSEDAAAEPTAEPAAELVAEVVAKKKGGRKPKVAAEPAAEPTAEDVATEPVAELAAEPVAEVVAKKKGGRKPKVAAVAELVTEPVAEVVAKKKGGRKPKTVTSVTPSLTIEIPEISDMEETPAEPRRQTPRLEDDEEVEIEVEPLNYNGVDYLYDEKSNTVYDMESNVVGRMVNEQLELA